MQRKKTGNMISEVNIIFHRLSLENQEKILNYLKSIELESYSERENHENKNIGGKVL